MEEDEGLERIRRRKLMRDESKGKKSFPNKPIKLTDKNFLETIKNHSLVVVDFWASRCPHCFMIAPILEELARDYAGRIFFGKLNVDENQKIAMQFEVMSIPTLLVFKNGKLVDRIVGAMPKKILEPKITRYL